MCISWCLLHPLCTKYPSFNSTWGINLRELNVTETVVQVVQLVSHPSFHTGPTSQAEGAGFEYVIVPLENTR